MKIGYSWHPPKLITVKYENAPNKPKFLHDKISSFMVDPLDQSKVQKKRSSKYYFSTLSSYSGYCYTCITCMFSIALSLRILNSDKVSVRKTIGIEPHFLSTP